jgi:hypothetical protein
MQFLSGFDRSSRIGIYEIRFSSASKVIPCGGIFRFKGHPAFHLIDPIRLDAAISYPNPNRLESNDRRGRETNQQKSFP